MLPEADRRLSGWGGVSFAGLILVKLLHVTLAPFFIAYLLALPRVPGRIRKREASLFMVPVVGVLAAIASLNFVRFGSIWESGYGTEAGLFFFSQLPQTVPRLLGSFDEGLWVFCPVLVLGVLGLPAFARRHPREAALCFAVVLINLMLAWAWHSWGGGWSWGPRLLVPAIPLWLLPAAAWLQERRSPARARAAVALIAVSIVLQIPGVLVKDQQIHHIKQNLLTPEERAQAFSDSALAWSLLWHKVSEGTEVYEVSAFGVAGRREVDLTAFDTFAGLNIWTEHLYRQTDVRAIRWFPLVGLVGVGGTVGLRVRQARRGRL